MKKTLFLLLLSNFLFSKDIACEENLSKALSSEIMSMKNSVTFLDYSLSVVNIMKIYKSLKNKKNCVNSIEKNPLPSSNIIFEKLDHNKYALLEKWEKVVSKTKPKNVDADKVRMVRKIMSKVRQKFKPILDKVYEHLKEAIINDSEKNIESYISYVKEISKLKTTTGNEINDEAESIVLNLSKMIISSPKIYIDTYHEHQSLERMRKALVSKKFLCPKATLR